LPIPGAGDVGSILGDKAGSMLSKWLGHGDYRIAHNTLVDGSITSSSPIVPKFSSAGKRGIRIVEREFLGDVFSSSVLTGGSTDFGNVSYPINPTDPNTFPWLSMIATQFDQWEPDGIIFEFISTSSEFNGTSQALGVVVMATDYDVNDPLYATKQTMENSDYACSTKASECLIHGIECAPSERPTRILYTSAGAFVTSLGNFQIATAGCSTANVRLGELWVSYDITFYKKQIDNTLSTVNSAYITATNVAAVGFFANPVYSYNLGFSITQNVGVGSVLRFPPNLVGVEYLVYIYYTATSFTNAGTMTGFNCTFNNYSVTNAAVAFTVTYFVKITGPNATMTGGLTTATTGATLVVSQVNNKIF